MHKFGRKWHFNHSLKIRCRTHLEFKKNDTLTEILKLETFALNHMSKWKIGKNQLIFGWTKLVRRLEHVRIWTMKVFYGQITSIWFECLIYLSLFVAPFSSDFWVNACIYQQASTCFNRNKDDNWMIKSRFWRWEKKNTGDSRQSIASK